MKLIDKDALVAEIERRIKEILFNHTENALVSKKVFYKEILSFLNTLEVKEVGVDLGDPKGDKSTKYIIDTKTLEVKEVDFEKIWKEYFTYRGDVATVNIKYLAKHFFELGLNSQTKDMQEALRMEYEKGRADVLRVIDPDEMVADFCSQPLSKTRSLASIYRQGIIDIIKRINKNEKTSINSTRSIDDGGVHRG